MGRVGLYETLLGAFKCFKKHNPCISNVKIVMVDKDFTGIKINKELWPKSKYLCTWHVIKYLRKQSLSMGKSTKEVKQNAMSLVYKVIHANTEANYGAAYDQL